LCAWVRGVADADMGFSKKDKNTLKH
jgi:hypothetical protein